MNSGKLIQCSAMYTGFASDRSTLYQVHSTPDSRTCSTNTILSRYSITSFGLLELAANSHRVFESSTSIRYTKSMALLFAFLQTKYPSRTYRPPKRSIKFQHSSSKAGGTGKVLEGRGQVSLPRQIPTSTE